VVATIELLEAAMRSGSDGMLEEKSSFVNTRWGLGRLLLKRRRQRRAAGDLFLRDLSLLLRGGASADCGVRANVRGGVMQTMRRKKDAKARPAWRERTATAREFEAAIIGGERIIPANSSVASLTWCCMTAARKEANR